MADRHHVVIVGGGFAGLNAAKQLRHADVDITLVDRTNHHLFQPLLYQVATGGLSPADIASPIRRILRRQRNVRVVMDTIVDIDVAGRQVIGAHVRLEYDTLIVAAGARHHYFGHEDWEAAAPGLKTLDDATLIRARILSLFEQAERGDDVPLTFIVVGGGPTGLEMAGAMAEMARHTLRKEYRRARTHETRVVLVEAADRLLLPYPPQLSDRARRQLEELGVEVRLGWRVEAISGPDVTMTDGSSTETIRAGATVWAAGVRASSLGEPLARAGAPIDRAGRILVDDDLTMPGHPEVFVIGDMAAVESAGEPVPGTSPAAIQMGRYAAQTIRRRLGGQPTEPFRFRDKGSLATIGRSSAVADLGPLHFSGWPAWVAWLAIHIYFLIGFENRLLVMIQWAWNYVTWNRSARLIR